MLLATIFLTASANAVSIHRIPPAAAAAAASAAAESGPLASRPSRSLEEFSGVNQKQATNRIPPVKAEADDLVIDI